MLLLHLDPDDPAHPEDADRTQTRRRRISSFCPVGSSSSTGRYGRRNTDITANRTSGTIARTHADKRPSADRVSNLALKAEATANDVRDLFENLGEIAAGLLLHEHAVTTAIIDTLGTRSEQSQHGAPHVVAVVDVGERQLEFPCDRVAPCPRPRASCGVERVAGSQCALHDVDGVGQLLVEFARRLLAILLIFMNGSDDSPSAAAASATSAMP